jgi:hypothetical protein
MQRSTPGKVLFASDSYPFVRYLTLVSRGLGVSLIGSKLCLVLIDHIPHLNVKVVCHMRSLVQAAWNYLMHRYSSPKYG